MCYHFIMNKEVIYIEPEDDITDVIHRIKTIKPRVAALVPSKKMSVMRSAVNVRLIAKAAKSASKTVVLVSNDRNLLKIAAAAGIPVAETIKSRPILPSEYQAQLNSGKNDTIEITDADDTESPVDSSTSSPNQSKKSKAPDISLSDSDSEKKTDSKEKASPAQKKSSSDSTPIPKLEKYRKLIIAASAAFVVLIGFLIWAIFLAPSVKIAVSVRTTGNNFSESVTLLANSKNNFKTAKFSLTEYSHDQASSVEFDATGEKDVGNKAGGSVVAAAYFRSGSGSVSIPAGAIFNYNGLKFAANSSSIINYQEGNKCDNAGNEGADIAKNGCRRSVTLSVTAIEAGDKYNVNAGRDWSSNIPGLKVHSEAAMTGGTSRIVKIVRQADIEKAKSGLESNTDQKSKLLKKVPKDVMAIEPSYKVTAADPVSSPAVGAEAPNGKAKLTAATHYVIYGTEKSNITKFIKKVTKPELSDDQKIYSFGKPRFENLSETNGGFTAKLKTVYKTGPKVSQTEVLEKSKGRKIGEVQSLIKSINGVNDVKVDPSFFWVHSVPNDPNRISIDIKIDEEK